LQEGAVLKRLSLAGLADRLTLREQTAAMTGLLCILVVAIVASGAAWLARRDAVRDANLELVALARTMSDRLDQNMFERYREIGNLARLEPLRGVWQDNPARARAILMQLQHGLSDYAWLGLADSNGAVRAATRGMLEGVSVAQRPWFINGSAGPTVEDVHDAKLLDSLLRQTADEAPFRFVDVAMPVFGPDGAKAGVLGAHLSWNWAGSLRDNVLRNHDPALGSELWVVGRDGTVLLGPKDARPFDPARLAAARYGISFVDESGGRAMLTALVATKGQDDYPGLGWLVAARRPVDVALAPANRLTGIIGLLGFAVALASAALAWYLAGTVTRPLTRLCSSIDLIGRDPSARGVERQHGSRDILHLSAALRSLLRRLGVAERGIREAQDTIREVQAKADEQARAAEEKTRRLGSDLHSLQVLADTDPLTGLFNRRAFQPFAEDAMNYYKRYRRGFGILMFDIDHFKQVNDTFGHAAGDEVIRSVGKIIADQIRATDKVARFGGEEFVVMLREVDEDRTRLLANRIREAVAATVVTQGLAHRYITISVGVAMAGEQDRDIEDVIERADRALYAAKSAGRNRVMLSQPGQQPSKAAA
jgi:diguanylate cyclase (GGDEF)-like protein